MALPVEHPLGIESLDYNYISDGFYIGTNICCILEFDGRLKKEGITADISLEKERIDEPEGVDFYVWIPVEDHTAPNQEQLDFGVAILEKLALMKRKVYVHCKRGHGRAPTLVAAYFIKQGKGVDEAIALIKSKRPAIHLQDVQKDALVEFSKRINQI